VLHLALKSVYQLDFLLEFFFLLKLFASLLIVQLTVTTFFFKTDLFFLGICLLYLSLPEKLDMLFLQLLIHASLFKFLNFSILFFSDLSVELFFDKFSALLLSDNCLFLFFIMKQGVELLDGCPLILFC
jgi:hypothetical protein